MCENNNKKRRVERKELLNHKKRKFSEVETPKKKEYCKFKKVNQYFLRRERVYQNNEYYCLLHHEKYICDIYECRGVHTYSKNNFVSMPYII